MRTLMPCASSQTKHDLRIRKDRPPVERASMSTADKRFVEEELLSHLENEQSVHLRDGAQESGSPSKSIPVAVETAGGVVQSSVVEGEELRGSVREATNTCKERNPTRQGNVQPFEGNPAFLDFSGLAAKLVTTEQWVRRNVRPTYTRDPIPHLRFGRIIRFVWDSVEMQQWIERHKAIADAQKSTVASLQSVSYNEKRTGFGSKSERRRIE
jgi:hypothetical protein